MIGHCPILYAMFCLWGTLTLGWHPDGGVPTRELSALVLTSSYGPVSERMRHFCLQSKHQVGEIPTSQNGLYLSVLDASQMLVSQIKMTTLVS